jgi:hypothetical protein
VKSRQTDEGPWQFLAPQRRTETTLKTQHLNNRPRQSKLKLPVVANHFLDVVEPQATRVERKNPTNGLFGIAEAHENHNSMPALRENIWDR